MKWGNHHVDGRIANTVPWPNVGSMLGQRRRRWANFVPTFGQRILVTVNEPTFRTMWLEDRQMLGHLYIGHWLLNVWTLSASLIHHPDENLVTREVLHDARTLLWLSRRYSQGLKSLSFAIRHRVLPIPSWILVSGNGLVSPKQETFTTDMLLLGHRHRYWPSIKTTTFGRSLICWPDCPMLLCFYNYTEKREPFKICFLCLLLSLISLSVVLCWIILAHLV